MGCVDRPRCAVHVTSSVVSLTLSLMLIGCGHDKPATTTETTTTTTSNTTTSTTSIDPNLPYTCKTNVFLDINLKNMDIKGMAMDDDTMSTCTDAIIGIWPNTRQSRVNSLRLFASWKSKWGDETKRLAAWTHLEKFVRTNGVKVLLGVDTTTNKTENELQWQWALEQLKRLGKDSVMGMSFGNEMLNKADIDWDGYMLPWVTKKIAEMDKAGFQDVKIMLVWSMQIFDKISGKHDFPFLDKMKSQYSHRWVWSVNPYAIWDTNVQPTSAQDCKQKTAAAIGIDYIKSVMTSFRTTLTKYTGNSEDILWIGETGWSSPFTQSQAHLNFCPEWDSVDTLKTYYQNFLEWDGSLNDGVKGVDQLFYFTNRDSEDFGDDQPFGLATTCRNPNCKIRNQTRSVQDLIV